MKYLVVILAIGILLLSGCINELKKPAEVMENFSGTVDKAKDKLEDFSETVDKTKDKLEDSIMNIYEETRNTIVTFRE